MCWYQLWRCCATPPAPALRDRQCLVWESRGQISPGVQEIRRSRGTRLRKGLGGGRTAGLPLGTQGCRWLLMGASTHVPSPASESWGIHADGPGSQTSPQEISPLLVLMRNPLSTMILNGVNRTQHFPSLGCRISLARLWLSRGPPQDPVRPSSRTWACEWQGTSGCAVPGAVLAAGSSDGFWPGLRMVPCLSIRPWEGEEEDCIPRDFLGFCWDFFFLGREWCCI